MCAPVHHDTSLWRVTMTNTVIVYLFQALREELARQRTTMLSNGPDSDPEKTARYAGQITKLEDQVARLVI